MIYILTSIASFFASLLGYPLAKRIQILDQPAKRKIHRQPVPRTGGIIFFSAFWLVLLAVSLFSHFSYLSLAVLGKIFLPALIIFIVGLLDDIFNLSPQIKLLGQLLGAGLLVALGIRIEVINIPLLGMITLNFWFSALATIFWVVLLINILNWLDGLNGLAAGVSIIAFLAIIYTAFLPWVNAFPAVLLASILIGILLAFLPYNFLKGEIFMGDSGSNFLGFMLALTSILGGSKLATSFLVLGLPILDGLWVIMQRIKGKKNIFLADKRHLHHRLLRLGLSEKQTTFFFWLISLVFGLLIIPASTQIKFFGLVILSGVCLIFFAVLDIIEKRNNERT